VVGEDAWYKSPMGRGITNILFGVVFIVGGLSGHLALIGTGSGTALAVLGGILVAFGIYRMIKTRGQSGG
jgi:hypothetical protein